MHAIILAVGALIASTGLAQPFRRDQGPISLSPEVLNFVAVAFGGANLKLGDSNHSVGYAMNVPVDGQTYDVHEFGIAQGWSDQDLGVSVTFLSLSGDKANNTACTATSATGSVTTVQGSEFGPRIGPPQPQVSISCQTMS